jgi:alginate O-acetyltransferase complex protein AlgI
VLFNSLVFAVFLLIVLAFHYACPRRFWTAERVGLLLASYVFYGWWDARLVSLLLVSTLVDFVAVRRIQSAPAQRRRWLTLSVVVNLGILSAFKYFNFFVGSAQGVLAALGLDVSVLHLDVVLPIGISFYTFQTMSLTIDAYRGLVTRRLSLLDVALYVAFFPQLVAGPIVRAGTFLPQVRAKPRFRAPLFIWGWWLIWLGLFKKVVIADNLADVVDAYMSSGDVAATSSPARWNAVLSFALQIYGDFSGYSDMAIGIAALMGIRFPRNFDAPYLAVSISDFWRRWHISLSTWLRDYLYIPLGGSRGTPWRTRRNLMLTMLLGGLWHGASWNFVLWGGLHGLLLVGERVVFRRKLHSRPRSAAADLGRVALTFLLATLLWVPFRAPDFASTLEVWRSMFTNWWMPPPGALGVHLPVLLFGLAMVAAPILRERGLVARRLPAWTRVLGSALIIYAVSNHGGGTHAFIYFQF